MEAVMDSEYYREMEYLCAPEPDWDYVYRELEWEATPDYDELMAMEDGGLREDETTR